MIRNLTCLIACAPLLMPTLAQAQLASSVPLSPSPILRLQQPPVLRRSMVLRYGAAPVSDHTVRCAGTPHLHTIRQVQHLTIKLMVLLLSNHNWLATGEPVVPGE